ncbi:hypothetical protein [Ensifer soli]|uniref:hypothetical protein n=1 Tax=Ciceribacter sp. sgz301302 TaxID=3342379 RepID=UPI0035BB2C7E
MFDSFGPAFFAALHRAAQDRLDPGHPCLERLAAAGAADDPAATLAAQEALAALDPAVAEAVMAQAHRLLRENPAGLLSAWPSAPTRH